LTLKGGSEAKAGLFQSVKDENTINFYNNKNKDFEEAKRLIEEKISAGDVQSNKSDLGELEKLAELKEKGIITEEEFNAKKKRSRRIGKISRIKRKRNNNRGGI